MSNMNLYNSLLAGKLADGSDFSPTTAQLNAMNSGINADKVTQIESNKTDIVSCYGGTPALNNLFNYQKIGTATIATGTGVTVTKNNDGTITLDGTVATADLAVVLYIDSINLFSDGLVIAGGNSDVNFIVQKYGAPYTKYAIDSGNSAIIADRGAGTQCYIMLSSPLGTVLDNVVITPVLCTQNDWNAAHNIQPYIMNNAELTAAIQAIQAQLAE